MKFLKATDYKPMPWKNGLGQTTELFIEPALSTLSEGNFDWRISSAHILLDSEFSTFKGYERLLVILSNKSIFLNLKELKPLTPIHFQGEHKIKCQIPNGEVTDLGIIYQRNRFSCSLEIKILVQGDSLNTINEKGMISFYFCIAGRLRLKSQELMSNESVLIREQGRMELTALENSSLAQLTIATG